MIDSFLNNFKNQFEEDDFDLSPETYFRELEGWDSMTSLMIVAMFDEIYNITLTSEDFQKAHTLEDLYNIIKSNVD